MSNNTKYIDKTSRLEDMSARGRLSLCRDGCGDIIISVQSCEGDFLQIGDSVEFCTIGMGGGRSPHTFNALLNLMEAMELDNEESPCGLPKD